jgi:hypothetical protein
LTARATARRAVPAEAVLGALSAAIAVGFAVHLARQLFAASEIAATDFTVFRTGWWLVLHGRPGDLYHPDAQAAAQRMLMHDGGFQGGLMAFLHPPHAALAGCPLEWVAEPLGAGAAFWLWTACNAALLVWLVRLVRDQLALPPHGTLLVAVTLAGFYPVFETLRQGQVSLLLAVAAFRFVDATHARRPRAAAGWLLVLSIKPQILPPLLAVLAARREWRTLAWAGALGASAVLLTAAILGPSVWLDYARNLRALERFFAAGTPEHMPTVRGLVARLLGARHAPLVDGLALAAWIAAIAASARRADLAFAFAAGALASPHLFPQDALIWAVPVTLTLAGRRSPRPLALAALAWPLWFVLARALDAVNGVAPPRLPVDLTLIPMTVALVWTARPAARANVTRG